MEPGDPRDRGESPSAASGYPRLSTALYVGMGWLALIAIRPLWVHVPVAGWLWLIAGGLAYTSALPSMRRNA
jgi:channel protein (hemolysin III family)